MNYEALEARPRPKKHLRKGNGLTWCGIDYFKDNSVRIVDVESLVDCKECNAELSKSLATEMRYEPLEDA